MAAIVNKEPIYVIVYDSGSQVMHASDYGSHVRLQKERITFLSIRHPKEFPNTVRFTAMIALDTFMKILGAYRKGELPRFSQKYVEKWQQAFQNIPELKIDERNLGDW